MEKGIWSEVTFRKTKEGRTKLRYRGFSYLLSKSENGKESWCCERKSCPGCLLLLNWEMVSSLEHNHAPKSKGKALPKSQVDKGELDTIFCFSNHRVDKNEKMPSETPPNTGYCWDGIKTPTLTKNVKKEMPDTPPSTFLSRSRILKRKEIDFQDISDSSHKSPRLETIDYVQYERSLSDEDISATSGSDEEYIPYRKREDSGYFRPARCKKHLHKFIKKEIEDDVEDEVKVPWWALQSDHENLWHGEGNKRILQTKGKERTGHDTEGRDNESQDEKISIKDEDIKEEEAPQINDSSGKAKRKKVQRPMNKSNTDVGKCSLEGTNSEDEDVSMENDNGEKGGGSWEEDSEDNEDGLWRKDHLKGDEIDDEKLGLGLKLKMRTSKIPKRKLSFSSFRWKTRTTKKWCQPRKFVSHFGLQTFPSMMKVLLGLLYLAVLLAKEHILLMDMLRWCQEGLIPYLSAPYLVKSALKSYTVNMHLIRSLLHVPDSTCVRKIAGELSIFLSLQSVPHPPVEDVVVHLASVLRLPKQTAAMAREIVSCYEKKKNQKNVPTFELPCVESLAMAALVIALKIWCGIDSLIEHHLSATAARLNAALGPTHSMAPLFSWDDWMRYITRLLWFCRQVDPLCGLIYSTSEMAGSAENRFLSELSQILTFCECAPAVHVTGLKKYANISNMMDAKGQSLQKLFDHPRVLTASRDPFHGIVEQFIALQIEDEKQQYPELLKMGKDLQVTSFASHQLFWPQNITGIQQKLKKCGSQIVLLPVKYPIVRHFGVPRTVMKKKKHSVHEASLTKELSCRFENSSFSSSSQSSDTEESCDSAYVNTSVITSSSSCSERVRGTRNGMCHSSRDSSSDSTDLEDDPSATINTSRRSTSSSGDSSSESDRAREILKGKFSSRSNRLFVPLPLYKVWRLKSKELRKKDYWKTLPHNYRWLITVGSLLCLVPKQQLINDVNKLEKSL